MNSEPVNRSLFKEQEINPEQSLVNLSKIAGDAFGFIRKFKRVRQYFDEPKFWYYSAIINNKYSLNDGRHFHTRSSGVSFFNERIAILKCLGEAVERYSNFAYLKSYSNRVGTIKQLSNKAIDPRTFSRFSNNQLKKASFKKYRITNASKFRWTKCKSLIRGEKVFIPSQFLFLSYPYLEGEVSIYPSISTGAAGGSCLSAGLVRGIYEIVERDAFMIFYLNKLPAPRIDLKSIKDSKVIKLLKIIDRYNLEIVSIDITTDMKIPAIASIIICRDGIGKAISVGLKSNIDPITALIGSIEESLHTRNWLREEYEKNSKAITPLDLIKRSDVRNRGLLWYPTGSIKNIDFWIESTNSIKLKEKKYNLTSGKQLEYLLNIIKRYDYEIYYRDITHQSFKDLDYFIVKVIMPRMQPLYLNEKHPLLGGSRLYEIPEKLGFNKKNENELNSYPHPFL